MAATTPIDAHATPETRALYSRLHEEPPGEIATFDVGGIEVLAGHNVEGVPFPALTSRLRAAHAGGALVTLRWSSVNPITKGGGSRNAAPMSAASVLPSGGEHEEFVRWLDHLAMFIEQLTDASGRPIPLVFELFHDRAGDRFWWSLGSDHPSASAEDFVALWRFTVEYLSGVAGVHNVLYALSPADDDGDSRGHPGDDYVDVSL